MNLIEDIYHHLKLSGSKISTAESCTAGFISKALTSYPGSSNYFEGSLIVYSNRAKINVLGVDEKLIDAHTEVSAAVACNMAERVREIMGTDYSIATTGYADPSGYGTEENPAGTIYVAVSTPFETISKRLELNESRSRNSYLATIEGLEMVRNILKTHQVLLP
jgi:PncC family amidohydrolase